MIEKIESILKDEFPNITNIKANNIANRICDAWENINVEELK